MAEHFSSGDPGDQVKVSRISTEEHLGILYALEAKDGDLVLRPCAAAYSKLQCPDGTGPAEARLPDAHKRCIKFHLNRTSPESAGNPDAVCPQALA